MSSDTIHAVSGRLLALALALSPQFACVHAALAGTPLTTVRLTSGFISGIIRPIYATAAPADTTRLFVVEQWSGKVKVLRLADNGVNATPFLTQPGVATDTEQGLLGLAFHPQYPESGYVYIHYTRTPDNAVVIRRYTVSGNPDVADSSSGTTLLTIAKPPGSTAHNGGWLGFGPDGYLYVAVGDGGPFASGNAQSDTTRNGKILRLDVDGGFPYAIPPDNPFAWAQSPKNEFWAKGLRNPWRCSFDRQTGDLYVADVGAAAWEEIDFQPDSSAGGENYGWPMFEGYAIWNCPAPCDSSGLTRPIHVYGHVGGRCSITGGYAYRGAAIPDLRGTYFFADYCSHQIWSLRVVGGAATEITERTAELDPPGDLDLMYMSSFAEDARGEVYILDHSQGEIFRIVAADPTGIGGVTGGAGGAAGNAGTAGAAADGALVLGLAAPNPSRRGFVFPVLAPEAGAARLAVYDAGGRSVRTIVEGRLPAGASALSWDARDDGGAPVAAGVYVATLEQAGRSSARKITVLR